MPRSLVVTARLSAKTLARLLAFWSCTGQEVPSASKLVALSLELLENVLDQNEMLPSGEISSAEACAVLRELGFVSKQNFRSLSREVKIEQLQADHYVSRGSEEFLDDHLEREEEQKRTLETLKNLNDVLKGEKL